MGLTAKSTGLNAIDSGININRRGGEYVIALAGNPNVGKSTVFNALTGMNQHTGNWPGKTVSVAQGEYTHKEQRFILVDIPGAYSLLANSAEEEAARDFICFGEPDAVVVVCDASVLERNLGLVLQVLEINSKVVVCVNLLDEAEKKHIKIDFAKLEEKLGIPVVGCTARSGAGLDKLADRIHEVCNGLHTDNIIINYPNSIENAVLSVQEVISDKIPDKLNSRWTALKLLDYNEQLYKSICDYAGHEFLSDSAVQQEVEKAFSALAEEGIKREEISEIVTSHIIRFAEQTAKECVTFNKPDYYERDRRIDKILTSRAFGVPIMIILLGVVFWLTITGANYPSKLISRGLFWLGDRMSEGLRVLHAPEWLNGVLVLGIYRVLAWVVSVMLPPMAIFFPLFTLLEDSGYLPRIAFNLDKHFKKARACGKQSLCMCMGFGCNAAGVTGCRIIDSPRERLIAVITNSFVPCNGRFPTIIAIISMFFVGSAAGFFQSILSAVFLTAVIVFGVAVTFLMSRLLSATILKGIPSSFTLELPPYRMPQIGKVIVRSVFDRTVFVLGRACAVAAPCGLVIWLLANITVGDASLLSHCSEFLDPFARFIGLDGVILLAFILGFPANEIVVPIIIMAYMAEGSILELESLSQLKALLTDNGWTWLTALCTILFSLMHWPCSTTCLTIKKETQSLKWTLVSFLAPTVTGIAVCAVTANIGRLFV